jgi:hypothetical protein
VQVPAPAPGASFGSQVLSLLIWLVPFLFIIWMWGRLSRGAASQLQGAMRVGRSNPPAAQKGGPEVPCTPEPGHAAHQHGGGHGVSSGARGSRSLRSRRAFTATRKLEPDMVRAAISGRSTSPKAGSNTPAAIGSATEL